MTSKPPQKATKTRKPQRGAAAPLTKPKKKNVCTRDMYSDEFKAKTVQEALAHMEGGDSLHSYCEREGLNFPTVWGWIGASDPDNSVRARVRERGTHALADKVQTVIETATPENASAARVKIDGYLRLAGIWNRKDFGEKREIDVTTRTMPDWSMLSDDAKRQLRAALEAQLRADGQPVPAAPMGLPAPSEGQE